MRAAAPQQGLKVTQTKLMAASLRFIASSGDLSGNFQRERCSSQLQQLQTAPRVVSHKQIITAICFGCGIAR
jgi:hypothetical protein